MSSNNCPVCGLSETNINQSSDGADAISVECPHCGDFRLSRTLSTMLEQKTDEEVAEKYAPRWVLSAAIRNRYEQGESLELATNTVETLLELARVPSDPFESMNLLLQHVSRKAEAPGQFVSLDKERDFPLVYARNPGEFNFYITKARELSLIEAQKGKPGFYRLELEGWKKLAELNKKGVKSDQVFVAMCFDPTLLNVYKEGFAPAIEQCGYKPTRIDLIEHNEKIDDKILAEIRRSALIIADFTEIRGGVYFEAGFAMGLGIPVLWSCHEKDIERLHFDTRQFNHIVWSESKDLKEKLISRINAKFPFTGSTAV